MQVVNEIEYKQAKEKNNDPYGSGVYRYLEAWADLMESRITAGEKLVDIAEETSHEADVEGITGYMYGCAVSVLANCWIHGEDLRIWHNKKTQIGTEGDEANKNGGVINPALIMLKQD